MKKAETKKTKKTETIKPVKATITYADGSVIEFTDFIGIFTRPAGPPHPANAIQTFEVVHLDIQIVSALEVATKLVELGQKMVGDVQRTVIANITKRR